MPVSFRCLVLALLAAGCAQGGPSAVPAAPASPVSLAASDAGDVRRLIRDHLETEALGFRLEVESLQILSPAYAGEYVFVANTVTRRDATGPALAWGRVVGSAWVSPRRKVIVWKERPRAGSDR
jgi:hypothetical protein